MTKLPPPSNKVQKTLLYFIKNKKATSVELSKATKVGYPPRKIQILERYGIDIEHDKVKYINCYGAKTLIAKYTMKTPVKEAKQLYFKMKMKKAA